MAKARHPVQPLVRVDGAVRFKENAIVRYLLDNGGISMNDLARLQFSREDRDQFAQLIGYSWSGAAELEYVSDRTLEEAQKAAPASWGMK